MKKVILGLDVSTTTIGICLMSYEDNVSKILKLTHISPKIPKKIKGIESLCLKKNIFENECLSQYKDYGITDVVIEEPLLGSNNINTVGTLLRFNGMISDSVYRLLGIVPEYISSYDARKYSFPELLAVRIFNKKGERYKTKEFKNAIKNNNVVLFGNYKFDIGKKDVILWFMSNKYPEIDWVYNKNGELKKENFDASDAAVCCLGYIRKIEFGEITPTIVDVEYLDDKIQYNTLIWNTKYPHVINIE